MNWYVIAIGALMLCGSLATINSASATKFDHDLSLLLLLGGVAVILYGAGVLDSQWLDGLLA